VLYYIDDTKVIGFDGSIFFTSAVQAGISCLSNKIQDKLSFYSNNNELYINNLSFSNNGTFYSKWYEFGGNVFIRRIWIEFAETMASGDLNTIKLYNEAEATTTLTASYASQGAKRVVEFRDINFNALSFQLRLDTFDNLIRKITVEYDSTNQPV
jgi:hypothetical protein